MNKQDLEQIKQLIGDSQEIVIVQADNPDADSLGSATALDEILSKTGKKTHLYCGVDMPSYLHYLSSWSRVERALPHDFDCVIIVDASTETLLEKIRLDKNSKRYDEAKKIVLDHHVTVENPITSSVTINDDNMSSTAELVYNLATEIGWTIPLSACESIVVGILGDTQGLSNNLASADTYRVIANLIDLGVDRSILEEKRREHNKLVEKIYRYKAELINKTEITNDGRVACVVVNQDEINEYSPLYNPAALIQPDMLQIENVVLSAVFKVYTDGKITAAIRSNNLAPICDKLAASFGGGGHKHASGFKVLGGETIESIKHKFIAGADDMLRNGIIDK